MLSRQIAIALGLMILGTAATADEGQHSLAAEGPLLEWSGLFAGIHAGYGRGSTDWRFPFDEYYNVASGEGFSTKPDGVLFGGHLTLNRQFGHIVTGLEVSLSGAAINQQRTGPVTALFPEDRFKTKIQDLITTTGRLGYVHSKWLIYGNGGYATADVRYNAISGPPGPGVTALTHGRQNGWVLGGGVEYMILPAAVVGLEYNFVTLNGDRHSTTTGGTAPGSPFNLETDDIGLHAITARLSIQLGSDRPQPDRLK
jgi:opacity protein-like surface antigen